MSFHFYHDTIEAALTALHNGDFKKAKEEIGQLQVGITDRFGQEKQTFQSLLSETRQFFGNLERAEKECDNKNEQEVVKALRRAQTNGLGIVTFAEAVTKQCKKEELKLKRAGVLDFKPR